MLSAPYAGNRRRVRHELVEILLHYLLYYYCVYLGMMKEKWDDYRIALESWEGQDGLIYRGHLFFLSFLAC
jgi:hypothetical protein